MTAVINHTCEMYYSTDDSKYRTSLSLSRVISRKAAKNKNENAGYHAGYKWRADLISEASARRTEF